MKRLVLLAATRLPLLAPLAAAVVACAAPTPPTHPPPSGPPNVVIVMADDLGLGDLGCYNADSRIPTPHLDRLAEQGLRLSDCHSPSAVCTPTRYALLTGRYAWRTELTSGVLNGNSTNLIDPQRLTLADLLREQGYRTACIGKWHLGLGEGERTDWSAPLRPGPLDHGFDRFFGIPASLDMPPYLWVEGDRPLEPATGSVAASAHRRQEGGGFWRAGPIAPGFRFVDVLGELEREAVAFVENAVEQEPGRPFFLYLPLTAPHTPWVPSEPFRGVSEAGHYGDFVAQVDALVGELLAALEALGVAEQTLVIFTSDNGSHWPVDDIERWGHRANLDYRGQKADIWEGGHRVPLIARWPGRVPAGIERDDLACLTDLFATCAAIAGAELPDDAAEDSFDLGPVLRDEAPAAFTRTDAIHHSLGGMFALRRGRWKLIEGLGSGGFTAPKRTQPEEGGPTGQLYDLAVDPGETRNQWLERPEVVAELTRILDEQRESGRSRPR